MLVGLHRLLLGVDLRAISLILGVAHVYLGGGETNDGDFVLTRLLRENLLALATLQLRVLSLVLTFFLMQLALDLNRRSYLCLVPVLAFLRAAAIDKLVDLDDCKFATFRNFGGVMTTVFLKVLDFAGAQHLLLIRLDHVGSLRPGACLLGELHYFLGEKWARRRTLHAALAVVTLAGACPGRHSASTSSLTLLSMVVR